MKFLAAADFAGPKDSGVRSEGAGRQSGFMEAIDDGANLVFALLTRGIRIDLLPDKSLQINNKSIFFIK